MKRKSILPFYSAEFQALSGVTSGPDAEYFAPDGARLCADGARREFNLPLSCQSFLLQAFRFRVPGARRFTVALLGMFWRWRTGAGIVDKLENPEPNLFLGMEIDGILNRAFPVGSGRFAVYVKVTPIKP